MVRRNAFQSANRNGLVFDPATTAGWLARAIAYASENAGKNVGFAVLHVSCGELALCNHSNVGGNVGVSGTAPLAINDLVEVIRVGSVCWLHSDVQTGHRLTRRSIAVP